ncbi:hypothetical protein SALBM311S_11631 [Streptomyces alboniger]
MAAVADTPGGVAVLVARCVLAGPGLLRRPVPSAPGRGRAWRRGTSCWAPSGPAAARRPGSAGADRALLRRAERTPLAGRLPYTVPHAVLRFAPRPLAIPALRAVRGDPLRWISAQCAFRAAAAAPRQAGPAARAGRDCPRQEVPPPGPYLAVVGGRDRFRRGPLLPRGAVAGRVEARWVAGVWGGRGLPSAGRSPGGLPGTRRGRQAEPLRGRASASLAPPPEPGYGRACPTDRGEPPPTGRSRGGRRPARPPPAGRKQPLTCENM